MRVLSLETGEELSALAGPIEAGSVALSPDGSVVYGVSGFNNDPNDDRLEPKAPKLWAWRVGERARSWAKMLSRPSVVVAVSDDGESVWTTEDKDFVRHDAQNGDVLERVTTEFSIADALFLPGLRSVHSTAYVTTHWNGSIPGWWNFRHDLPSGTRRWAQRNDIAGGNKDANAALVVIADGGLKVLDFEKTNKLSYYRLQVPADDDFTCAAFSRDGRWLVAGTERGVLYLFEVLQQASQPRSKSGKKQAAS